MVVEVSKDTSRCYWWYGWLELRSRLVLVETRAGLSWRADVSWETNVVTRHLGPQASHCGEGNTVVTVFPRRPHSLACVMAAGRVRVMHRESVLHP